MTATGQRRGSTHVNLDNVSPRYLVRIQRLARELRLTDQMLSIDVDTVSIEASGPAPAWTTLEGDKVSFNWSQMPKPQSRLDIAIWLGTNAHELGHVLFSPRKDSTLMFRVLESDRAFMRGIATMHNIVEDQRQERLILGRFSPWSGYLTAALGHHLVADDNTAWLLMAGRTWLPDDVRAVAKARMIAHRGPVDTDRVTALVGEYQRLTDPGDTQADEAWDILQELHDLFGDEPPRTGGNCTVMEGGEPDTSSDPTDGPPTADEADGNEQSDGDGNGVGDDSDDDDDTEAADGDADGDDDADDVSGNGNDDGQSSDDGGTSGTNAGNSASSKPLDQGDTREALKDAAKDQIDSDEDAKSDLDSIVDAVDHGRPDEEVTGDEARGRYDEASDAARRLHREVSDALLDLKDESEPGWNKRVDSGRLNVRRALLGNTDADELFDRYEPGMMDATELEVVLCVDVSYSMRPVERPLGEAVWAIRQAVDDLEGSLTVLCYESGPHTVLASPDERPDGRMFVPQAGGGTEPKSAIREAYRLLSGAVAKNRLFIILTDGDWYGNGGNDSTIKALGDEGVTTVCALLGNEIAKPDDHHGCQHGAVIAQPSELALLFRKVAIDNMHAQWRR